MCEQQRARERERSRQLRNLNAELGRGSRMVVRRQMASTTAVVSAPNSVRSVGDRGAAACDASVEGGRRKLGYNLWRQVAWGTRRISGKSRCAAASLHPGQSPALLRPKVRDTTDRETEGGSHEPRLRASACLLGFAEGRWACGWRRPSGLRPWEQREQAGL